MFLIIDNYDSFTFNLVQAFHVLGLSPVVARNDDPALPEYAARADLTGVCLSPGPGRPEEAGGCLAFLDKLPRRVPVLGVCLGHQILALHAGALVEVSANIMHGKACSVSHDGRGVFAGLPTPMRAGRYHSLLVSGEGRERSFTVSARTEDGRIMGLRYTDRPWEGVQFHPESVLTPDGMRLLGNFAALALSPAKPEDGPDSIRAGEAACGQRYGRTSPMPGQAGNDAESVSPSPFRLATVMDALADGRDLSSAEARAAFSSLMDGEMSSAQAGAFLLGLRAKGETPEEMAEAVNAILERAVPVKVPPFAPLLDVVGTGGDGRNSFNCSTGTSLLLAAMGHQVLKHGNRSVSSRCGSADVLERLGLDLDIPVDDIPARLTEDGFVFLFAPRFHPSFRHIMPVRRELGVRTLFNLMGPLVNPARPGICFLGVAKEDILPLLAHTLARMGNRSGAVVCGAGGYDELTTMGPAKVAYVRGRDVRFEELDPARFGFTPCEPEELMIRNPEEGAAVLRDLLNGKGPEPMRQMLALNVGFGLHLLHPEKPLTACMAEARQALSDGTGGAYLRRLEHKRNAANARAEVA